MGVFSMVREIALAHRRDNGRLAKLVHATIGVLLALLLPALPAWGQSLPNLAALQNRGAAVSAMVVALDQGKVIAALEPDRQLTPASVTKLVTGTRALDIWGANHRFTTRLAATAPVQNGQLAGDLVLLGGADPALTEEGLAVLAREVALLGVREVAGDLIIDASRFGEIACSPADRCRAREQSAHSYAAPLSAAGVNFSTVSIDLRPGLNPGQQAWVQPRPFGLPSFKLLVEATTTSGGGAALTAVHRNLGDKEQTEIAGGLPIGNEGVSLRRSVAHPERLTGELLRGFLEREGVRVGGGLRFAYGPAPYHTILAQHESRSLSELLSGMMYYSNNFSADVLALDLARAMGSLPPLHLAEAGAHLGDYLRSLASGSRFAVGAEARAVLRDGSGLDPDNRLSARELISLLDYVYARLDLFQPLLGSLSLPAHARGTLLSGGDALWSRSVVGKTGGLSVPVSVTSYAGYLRFADGGWGAFAFLVNGAPGRPIARADAFEAMRRDFAILRNANAF